MGPAGQHIELGIAENNLFLLLGAARPHRALFGARVIPVGTLYDPFINRGLDALNYACYQDARFLLVATPSGLTLAPEGRRAPIDPHPADRHGRRTPRHFEPAYVDELAISCASFEHMQQPDGGSVYLRLSTRALEQPARQPTRNPSSPAPTGRPAGRGRAHRHRLSGAVAPEAEAAFAELRTEDPAAGLLAVTSPDRLHAGWTAALRVRREGDRSATLDVETILAPLAPGAALVTVIDGHPATLSWLGGVRGHRVTPSA